MHVVTCCQSGVTTMWHRKVLEPSSSLDKRGSNANYTALGWLLWYLIENLWGGKKRWFFLIASRYSLKKVWPSTRIERKKKKKKKKATCNYFHVKLDLLSNSFTKYQKNYRNDKTKCFIKTQKFFFSSEEIFSLFFSLFKCLSFVFLHWFVFCFRPAQKETYRPNTWRVTVHAHHGQYHTLYPSHGAG